MFRSTSGPLAMGTERILTEKFPERLSVYSLRAINAREQLQNITFFVIVNYDTLTIVTSVIIELHLFIRLYYYYTFICLYYLYI